MDILLIVALVLIYLNFFIEVLKVESEKYPNPHRPIPFRKFVKIFLFWYVYNFIYYIDGRIASRKGDNLVEGDDYYAGYEIIESKTKK